MQNILAFVSQHAPSAMLHHSLLLQAFRGSLVQLQALDALRSKLSLFADILRELVMIMPESFPHGSFVG